MVERDFWLLFRPEGREPYVVYDGFTWWDNNNEHEPGCSFACEHWDEYEIPLKDLLAVPKEERWSYVLDEVACNCRNWKSFEPDTDAERIANNWFNWYRSWGIEHAECLSLEDLEEDTPEGAYYD